MRKHRHCRCRCCQSKRMVTAKRRSKSSASTDDILKTLAICESEYEHRDNLEKG